MRSAFAAAVLAGAVLAAPGIGPAGEPADSGERARLTHAIARDLMSPFCPGRTLADCPSPDAAAVRQEIRSLVDAGVPAPEIRGRMEARFGDAVRGLPEGFWARALPIAVLAIGAAGLGAALLRMARRPAGPARPAPPAVPGEVESRLDRELREEGL